MKTLLLGAHGQLGTALRSSLAQRPLGNLVLATRRGEDDLPDSMALDLGDGIALGALLDRVEPEIVLNAAAYTAVDRAESDENHATAINGSALGVIGRWARERGALVAHVSTDYVFDGKGQRPYVESDTTDPVNAYGRGKLAGERLLSGSGAPHLIFRTAWLYSAEGRNFFTTMLKLASEREELRVVADQWGSPTSARLLADAMVTAVHGWASAGQPARAAMEGIHHCVATGYTSWHGFATAIVDGAFARGLLRHKPRILPVSTSEFPTPARRPGYSVLDNSRFKRAFMHDPAHWESALASTLDELTFLTGSE